MLARYGLLALVFSVSAQGAGWGAEFKVAVVDAVLQLLPSGLQARLPQDAASIRAAVKLSATLGGPETADHLYAVADLWRNPNLDRTRLLAELIALSVHYLDVTAPAAPDDFFALVDRGNAVSRARFNGYHRVKDYPGLVDLVHETTAPCCAIISRRVTAGIDRSDQAVADQLAAYFNIMVNVTVDVWTTSAVMGGVALGEGQALGREVHPRMATPDVTIYQPSGADTAGPLVELERKAMAEGLESELTVPAGSHAGNVDELVVEDGVTVSGSQAQQSAQQLEHSQMQVRADVRQFEGADEQTLAALRELGIDVNARRQPFHGTRGGVKPGQIIRVGEVDFNVGQLSTVEIGSREQRQVLMQIPDSAMGVGAEGGSLNQKVVAGVIQSAVGGFRSCFERRLRDLPNLAGRVFIQFTIGVDGAVTKAEVVQNTTNDAAFADCLIRQMMRLRFPKPRGGEVTFLFPFIFEQTL